MTNFSYNVPSRLIWSFHVIVGLYFTIMGFLAIKDKKFTKPEWKVLQYVLVILGPLMMLYHGRLLIASF
jgi:hypothetical protein